MNPKVIIAIFILSFTISFQMDAQNIKPHSIAVFNLEGHGISLTNAQIQELTRIELAKLGLYDVIFTQDIEYLLKKSNIDPNDCYNKTCLIEVGKKLKVEKVLTGIVELLGNKIVVNFRLIDVRSEDVLKNEIVEFLNIPNHTHNMIKLAVRKMFNQKLDREMMENLTEQYNYEDEVIDPHTENINASGPRTGFTIFTGDLAKGYELEKEFGGYEAVPVMFQFGYQFEVRYLSSGDFQALFEFIPLITGLDQGLFIPSFNFLHGLRSNKSGFEVAFGPSFSLVSLAVAPDGTKFPSPKGDLDLRAGFVFGAGKTFTSGRLNFPVNAFFIPGRSGHRFGISVGFNMIKKRN